MTQHTVSSPTCKAFLSQTQPGILQAPRRVDDNKHERNAGQIIDLLFVMLRASSSVQQQEKQQAEQQDKETGGNVFTCKCGFTSGSETTFQRHLRRFTDEQQEEHLLVATAAGPSALSYFGRLSTLWGGGGAPPAEEEDMTGVIDVTGEAGAEATDSTWEPDSDDYTEITKSLEESDEASTSWLSRTLGTWGRTQEESPTVVAVVADDDQRSQPEQVSAEDLENLLLWQDPMLTAKVAGGGAYALICIRHLVHGVEIIQPSTVLAFAAICAMIYSSARTAWIRRGQQHAPQAAEQALQQQVERTVAAFIRRLTPLLSATVSLVTRRLSAQSSKGSRVWLGFCLWLTICIGELGWVSQSSLALWLWVALFTLPGVYLTSRAALDALVDESVTFLLSALNGGQRGVLLGSAVLGLLTFVLVDAKIFMRLSLSAVASGAVLFWQAHHMKHTRRAS